MRAMLLPSASLLFAALMIAAWPSPRPPTTSPAPLPRLYAPRSFHRGDQVPPDLYVIVGCEQSTLKWGADVTFSGNVGVMRSSLNALFYAACDSRYVIMPKNGTKVSFVPYSSEPKQ